VRLTTLKRVKLDFVPGLKVDFVDRDRAIKQVYELSEKSTRTPLVVYGPEGCGKTSWLLQAIEVFKELNYNVIYFNPVRREFEVEVGIEGIRHRVLERLRQVSTEFEFARLVWLVIDIANEVLKHGRRRLAVIVDDVFQFIGSREAALFVKGLLELIEYPVGGYERIVAIVATSEGLSRREIGRHRWGDLTPMWNMSGEGFEELYNKLPSPKPSFEDVWRLCGGNPYMLSILYREGWKVDTIILRLIVSKDITPTFISRWRKWLELAVEDPDNLWDPNTPEELVNELITRNIILYFLHEREEDLWIDKPPPQKDLEIGVGRYVAWQTPIHREAVRKALTQYTSS
jgi:GTPase SAR1 family protein